jgi:hypothetical protein
MTGHPTSPPLVVSYLGSPVTFWREAGLPFQADLMGEFGSVGIENETVSAAEAVYTKAPQFPPERPPTASITVRVLIGFGLFFGAKLGEKLLDEIGTDLYQKIVRPQIAGDIGCD